MRTASRIFAGALFVALPLTPLAPTAPARYSVRTDDGHSLVVWGKKPAGAARGEIILLHGRTWSALPNFDLQVPGRSVSLMDAFVAEGYAVYAVDQRGYGASKRDATGWLTPDRAARDAADVIDWVAAQSPNHRAPALLGYSRGSTTAVLAAQRNPRKVSALVLYGFPYDMTSPPGPAEEPKKPLRERTTAEGAGEDFISPDSTAPGVKEAYVRAALRSDPVRVDWRRDQQWAEIDPRAVHTPTLFINGENDPVAEAGNIPAFLTNMSERDREWIVLARSDHVAHLERQSAFVNGVVGFLNRLTQH
jgi:pimeloyl-ACP methyl ester carboxylesterase